MKEVRMSKRAATSAGFIDIGAVDRFLVEHSSFTVLDWLLAEGTLAYTDYAAWRDGNRETLDDALPLAPADVDHLLAEVDRHGHALHLAAEAREVFTWSTSNPEVLKASKRTEAHRRLVQQWRRANPAPQFDLFMDNAASVAESRLSGTLSGRRFDEATRDLGALSRLDPANKSLGHYQDLINYGRHLQTPAPADAHGLRAELDGLEQEVQPLARALLAANARDYLTLAWQRLAKALKELPAPENPDDRLHPSYALAQIPDWEAVRQCLETEPRLLKQPRWLQLLARACRATGKPEAGLLWWLVCIERHPDNAASALEQCDDPVLTRLFSDFLSLQNRLRIDLPESGFPGFVLLRRPGLVHYLSAVAPLERPETVLMVRLIEARRDGKDEIALRKCLGEIDLALLAMYLQVGVR
jgi:hypothetical protein